MALAFGVHYGCATALVQLTTWPSFWLGNKPNKMDGVPSVNQPISITTSVDVQQSSTARMIVVGVGKWGTNIAREAHALGYLSAIADTNKEKAKIAFEKLGSPANVTVHDSLDSALKAYPSIPVAVCTPPSTHYECAKIALAANRDVWVEKPLCSKLEDAIALVNNGRSSNRVIFVDHLLQYYATHRKLLNLVKSGFVGEVTRVRAIRLNFGTVRTSENALWSLSPHDVSLILAVCGNKLPEIVKAEGQSVISSEIEDYVDVHLTFSTGTRAHLSSSWFHYEKERRLVVYGRDGCLVVNESDVPGKPKLQGFKWSAKRHADGSNVAIEKSEEDMDDVLDDVEEGEVPDTESPVCAALKEFMRCCFSRNAPITDGCEGLRVLRVLSAASESLKTGLAVKVSNEEIARETSKDESNFVVQKLVSKDESCKGEVNRDAKVPKSKTSKGEASREVEVPEGETSKGEVSRGAKVAKVESSRENASCDLKAPRVENNKSEVSRDVKLSKGESSKSEGHPGVEVRLRLKEETYKYFAHPTAVIDSGAVIGCGSNIWHFSHIMSGAVLGAKCNIGQNVYVGGQVVIGAHVKVQNNVSIYDGVIIENEVFLGPHCVFTNVKTPRSAINRRGEYVQTVVRKGATIGANATIVCGITLGEYSFVGAGAVVTKDVPAHALVYGNPATIQGWVSQNGTRLVVVAKMGNGKMLMQCSETRKTYNFDGVDTVEEAINKTANGDEQK